MGLQKKRVEKKSGQVRVKAIRRWLGKVKPEARGWHRKCGRKEVAGSDACDRTFSFAGGVMFKLDIDCLGCKLFS